eukprot:1146605-Pelagomonas_calceolata.AAC.3
MQMQRSGHGGDVRWVDWHPRMGLIASGSKDALTKLWDPRCVAVSHRSPSIIAYDVTKVQKWEASLQRQPAFSAGKERVAIKSNFESPPALSASPEGTTQISLKDSQKTIAYHEQSMCNFMIPPKFIASCPSPSPS